MPQRNNRSPGAFEGCSCDVPRRDGRLQSARNRIAEQTNQHKKETGDNCGNCNACSIIKHRAKRHQIQGQDYSRILLNVAQIQAKHAHAWLYTKQGENSPHAKAPARERGIAWGACDKAASFGIANSFIVAPESQKRNL